MSRGKTWVYWFNRIQQEMQTLFPDVLGEERHPCFVDNQERDRILSEYGKSAEENCQSFCKSGAWPEMTADEKTAVYFRLQAAFEFVERLVTVFGDRTRVVVRPPDIKITPEPQVWEFLLFSLWEKESLALTVRLQKRENN